VRGGGSSFAREDGSGAIEINRAVEKIRMTGMNEKGLKVSRDQQQLHFGSMEAFKNTERRQNADNTVELYVNY
jgi:hypothetical protein